MKRDVKFGLLSEEEKNNIIRKLFQQRLELQIITDINNNQNPSIWDNAERVEYIQSLLTYFPPNYCEMVMSIRKIDSSYFENATSPVTPNIATYDFYTISIFGESGKIDFFCNDHGGSDYLQLNNHSGDSNSIRYNNYLIAINTNAYFNVITKSNDILLPEILFLNEPMLEYSLSKYYLNYLVFHDYELGIESFRKWLAILSYTEYLPKDVKLESESNKYYIFKFYSMEKKMTIRAKVYKEYPNSIEYIS